MEVLYHWYHYNDLWTPHTCNTAVLQCTVVPTGVLPRRGGCVRFISWAGSVHDDSRPGTAGYWVMCISNHDMIRLLYIWFLLLKQKRLSTTEKIVALIMIHYIILGPGIYTMVETLPYAIYRYDHMSHTCIMIYHQTQCDLACPPACPPGARQPGQPRGTTRSSIIKYPTSSRGYGDRALLRSAGNDAES